MGRTQPILLFCKTVLPSVGRKMKLAALKATIHLAAKVLCFAGTLAGLKRVSIICSLLNFPVGTTGYLASSNYIVNFEHDGFDMSKFRT